LESKKRKVERDAILANFQFCLDGESEETYAGITMNVSSAGFGFLTETGVKPGQSMMIMEHTIPDLKGRSAKVIWTRRGRRYVEAGAEFTPGSAV
jgi:hypothetical protein